MVTISSRVTRRAPHPDLWSRRHGSLTACWLAILALWGAGHWIGPTRVEAVPPGGTAESQRPLPEQPVLAEASDEGQLALRGFRIPEGLGGALFAAEPQTANPVAFTVDGQGRVWVCESFRQGRGVTDNRKHDDRWLEADLAARTVHDRIEYHRRLLGKEAEQYTRYDDLIRRLEDRDGDGRADVSSVFASGFNRLEDGTGAGILVHGRDVFYTCIPHLWRVRDEDGDGRAEERTSLHYGFGVRVAFRGHDMHGLCLGPDGRLYFSIGDRGYNVRAPGGHFENPDSGAVFRCQLDGSQLEVFATGLRNPQELAFDDYGNLFTGDNNSDSGDRARWVYVVEGGDSGWRMYYQYLRDRGPFNQEKIWHPHHPDQPAYIVPPIANFADGPSGLAYYPGTGLGDAFQGRFLLCDFRGGPAQSGIRSFRLAARGAFFEMQDAEQPFWNILATDLAFGPDGSLYVSDWVNGWEGEGKGRIYRFFRPGAEQEPAVQQVRQLLATGLGSLSIEQLGEQLGHRDQRIRQAAQFELARRGQLDALRRAALDPEAPQLARLHGLWGLWQLGQVADPEEAGGQEGHLEAVERVVSDLLGDTSDEMRAQAARVAGDLRLRGLAPRLVELLRDEFPRARYFAALGVGKLGCSVATPDLLALLDSNAGTDPILRHGGIMGLAGVAEPEQLAGLSGHPSDSVRRAVVVALRRQQSSLVADFLDDREPRVAAEAARAIYDQPLKQAWERLAAHRPASSASEPLVRRVLNANLHQGDASAAERLAVYAGRSDAPDSLRLLALELLEAWPRSANRDALLGRWAPRRAHRVIHAQTALRGALASVLSGPDTVREKGIQVAASLGLDEVRPLLERIVQDARQPAAARSRALTALAALKDPQLPRLLPQLEADDAPLVRIAARRAMLESAPDEALSKLTAATRSPVTAERQDAFQTLADVPHPSVDAILQAAMDRLLSGQLPADTQLDVLEAARRRQAPAVQELVRRWDDRLRDAPATERYAHALHGGDPAKGRQIFFERTQVSCVRCHKIGGRGGEVGPDLTSIAKDKPAEYLLEAIVDPNKSIAKNFASVMVLDVSGRVHAGVLRGETAEAIELVTADGKLVRIPSEEIEERRPGKSAMPEDLLKSLTPGDVRDLVAFLAGLRGEPVP